MTIYLNGIELPDLVVDQEFSQVMVEARVARGLGGGLNIWKQIIQGKPIDLVGGSDFAWITRGVLKQLYALASDPAGRYTLSYEGVETTVIFRHEEAPVIEATPIVPRPNHSDADWYYGVRLKLMEV